jgi:endoglucanase
MKQLSNKILLLIIYCGLSCCSNCSNKKDDTREILVVSTNPEENSIVSAATKYITFEFNKGIYIADIAKITLNGIAMPNTTAYGTSLTVKTNSLKSSADYELIIDKEAIRDGAGNLNSNSFSLKFKTMEPPVKGGSVSQNGFLSVKGLSLVNQDGREVVLRGVSFGWHNWWYRFYNEQTVTWLKEDWKCDVVRAAIGVEPSGAYLYNPYAALNCLYAVVDAAIKNDMYVIVDWHSHSIKLDEAKAFFQQVAEKYKDYPNIIYEIFNEPDGPNWNEIKAYSVAVIETIRAIDKKNIILVGTPTWSQDVDLSADNPITGYDNLMYTLHFYATTHGQYYRDKAEKALQKGLPVFISECAAMEATGDGQFNMKEWQTWLQWMNERNISWLAWSISDKDETCSMIKNTSSPVSGWTDSDLKEWGLVTREELRK